MCTQQKKNKGTVGESYVAVARGAAKRENNQRGINSQTNNQTTKTAQ